MPEDAEAGMSKQDLKKLLVLARRQPINCAIGRGDGETANQTLILLDRVKPPKALLAQLRKDCPKLKTPCFGTAAVDARADPKLVTFSLNKKVSGMPRQLRASLKGTGFTKVAVEKGGGPNQDDE